MPLSQELTTFTTASQAIVSYPYSNIESGLGIQTYYPAITATSAATDYILLDQVLPSAYPGALVGGTAEVDFDLEGFKVSKTMKGTAVFSGDCAVTSNTLNVKVTLTKVDGVTAAETTVGAAVTSPALAGSGFVLLQLPLTETVFAVGDILRCSIDVGGINAAQRLGVDPSGQANNGLGYTMNPAKLNIPFKLDL